MEPEYIVYNYGRREFRHALKQANPVIFEDSLHFLEDHPRTFGSGYRRELIWRYIRRYDLGAESIARLENAALSYLERPMSREFKFMCQTMARIATPEFWDKVEAKLNSDNPRIQVNAYCLFAYSKGIYAGEKQRLELKVFVRRNKFRPYDLFSVDELLTLMSEPENWLGRRITHKAANASDLPIIYYYDPTRDMSFATLDMHLCRVEVLLPKLKQILSMLLRESSTDTTWLYIIYLFQQLDNPAVVPILIDFLRDKVDYKYEGVTKGLLQRAALKVLRYYSTPEATEAVHQHAEADKRYAEYYTSQNAGWSLTYP